MNRRTTYLVMILALWTFQMGFGLFIVVDAGFFTVLADWFFDRKTDADIELKLSEVPPLNIGLTRFICGVVMHIYCDNEL